MHNLINILFVIYIKKNPLTFQGLNKLNQMNYLLKIIKQLEIHNGRNKEQLLSGKTNSQLTPNHLYRHGKQ